MQEIKGNIWDYLGRPGVICITTNLGWNSKGEAVMGRGIALEAKERYPGIDKRLGELLQAGVYKPTMLAMDGETQIWSFPTKPPGRRCSEYEYNNKIVPYLRKNYAPGDHIPSWAWKSDINLILSSAREMLGLAEEWEIYCPRPGCGNGQLDWHKDVKPRLEQSWQQDKYKVVSFTI